MVNLFRRFQQPLLLALTILVIISFVVIYGGPGSRLDRLGSDDVAKIYGRSVSTTEYRSIARQFEVLQRMGMFDLILPLAQNARTMQEAVDNYVWNTLVLRKEAKALGILPTDDQVVEAIKNHPLFQDKGAFSKDRYEYVLFNALSPKGMGPGHFDEIMRDSLRMQAIREALSAASTPALDELTQAYQRQYQKIETAILRFPKAAVEKEIKLSDEDLKKAFEGKKDSLKTEEKRAVDYVLLPLPAPDKDGKRPEPEQIQKLADKASDLAGALLEPNAKFEDVAKRFEAELKSTAPFTKTTRLEEFGNAPNITAAAFQLTKEKPFSEAISAPKGYVILRLKSLEEARPLSFEEAKAKLAESLKAERTRETLALKAADARKKIDEALKAGKSFVEAAKSLGLNVETPEPFSRSESKLTGANASVIQQNAADLKEGLTSGPLEGAEETSVVHVLKRLPIDPADVEKKKADLAPMLETQRVDGLLSEWIDRQRSAASLQLRQARG